MSQEYVKGYQEGMFFAFGHYEKFLEICGYDAWKEKAGGWTLAQQFYHGLVAANMLLASLTGKPAPNPNPEAGQILDKPDVLPSKEQAAEFFANIRIAAQSMFESLQDETLLKKNEGVSQKFGRDVTNAVVLELIPAHLLYHLGSCDAALRNRNLPGAW